MSEIQGNSEKEKPSHKWVMLVLKVLGVAFVIFFMVMAYINKRG